MKDKLVKMQVPVKVQLADIEKLVFNVDAIIPTGKGSLQFYYKNLNNQLMKKVDGKTELQKQGLISLPVNKLIPEPNNPKKKGILRPEPFD